MTINEFRKWLNQLIEDKKGALPDLADWKLIKENLDQVKEEQDTEFSILQSDDDEYQCTGFDPEPYDFQFNLDLLDRLCEEAEDMYNDVFHYDGLHNQFYNEYIKDNKDGKAKTESSNRKNTTSTST